MVHSCHMCVNLSHLHSGFLARRRWALAVALHRSTDSRDYPSVSSLPLSVMVRSCHMCINLSRLHSGFLAGRRWALAVALHHGTNSRDYPRMFSLREIFKCAHLKFTVYGRKQTSKHTHAHVQCSHASVGLTQAYPQKTNHQHLIHSCWTVILQKWSNDKKYSHQWKFLQLLWKVIPIYIHRILW